MICGILMYAPVNREKGGEGGGRPLENSFLDLHQ